MGIKLPMKAHTAVACVLYAFSLSVQSVSGIHRALFFQQSCSLLYPKERKR